MKFFKYRFLSILNVIIIIAIFLGVSKKISTIEVYNDYSFCICIDPGHGGDDGGAEVGDVNEEDINLSVSKILKEIFEDNDYKVVLTRDDDYHLPENSSFSKKNDLDERIKIINQCNIFISIHANKFSLEYVNGAQVFYNSKSVQSLVLASLIQKQFQEDLDNVRKAKSISDIYLLENVTTPGVIVEVGFMSNKEELAKLLDEDYQRELSYSIFKGLITYINYNS